MSDFLGQSPVRAPKQAVEKSDEALNLVRMPAGNVKILPISDIFVDPKENARREYDPAKLDELARSLAEHGQFHNVVVRPLPHGKLGPNGEHYQLSIGYRRVRAAEMAGYNAVWALIRDCDAVEPGLAENIAREDLSLYDIIEHTRTRLIEDRGYNAEQLADRLQWTRAFAEDVALFATELSPVLRERIRHDVTPVTLLRLRQCACTFANEPLTREERQKKQEKWWIDEGWKEPKKPLVKLGAKSAKPERIMAIAERVRAERGVPGSDGEWLRLSAPQVHAVYAILRWCANPRGKGPPTL